MFGKQVLWFREKFFACFLALMFAANTVALPLAFAEGSQNPDLSYIDEVFLDEDGIVHWPTNLILPAVDDEYATDNIIVVFKLGITVNQAYAALEDVGLFDITKEKFTITQEIIDKQRIYSAYLKEGVTVCDALTKVFAHPDIDWAEANGFVRLDSDFDVEEASISEYVPYALGKPTSEDLEIIKPVDKAANLLDPNLQTAAIPATADALSLAFVPTILMAVASVVLIITGIQIRRRRLH